MGGRVRMHYIDTGGVFRRVWITQKQEHPVTLVNDKDAMLHLLRGNPIFAMERPTPLENLEDILSIRPPYIGPNSEDRMIFCEENNPWPIGMISRNLTYDEQNEQVGTMHQEWIQQARERARQKNLGEVSVMSQRIQMFIALGFGILIAVMVIMQIAANSEVSI